MPGGLGLSLPWLLISQKSIQTAALIEVDITKQPHQTGLGDLHEVPKIIMLHHPYFIRRIRMHFSKVKQIIPLLCNKYLLD